MKGEKWCLSLLEELRAYAFVAYLKLHFRRVDANLDGEQEVHLEI